MITVRLNKKNYDEVQVYKKNSLIRKIPLIPGKQYVVNPITGKVNKKTGRKVIFMELVSTPYGIMAKVKYLNTQRPGKVNLEDLDQISAELTEGMRTLRISNELQKETVYNELLPHFELFLKILNLIDNKKNKDNIALISQKEMAEKLSTSPSNISKRILQLIRYGALEKVDASVYKLLNNSIWYTPYRLVHSVINLLNEQPELASSFKEQAAILDVSIQDIFQARAYIEKLDKKA
jgi:hypothetical protein